MPAGAVITSLVDFLISFVILIALMGWYRFMPGWQFLTLPLWTVWAFLAALGPGLYITALNVKYRDFRYVIPFIVQFGLYVSPVAYSSAELTTRLHIPPHAVFAEPHRGCDRRLPLGHRRRVRAVVLARVGGVRRDDGVLPVAGGVVLPQNGKNLRRRDLIRRFLGGVQSGRCGRSSPKALRASPYFWIGSVPLNRRSSQKI